MIGHVSICSLNGILVGLGRKGFHLCQDFWVLSGNIVRLADVFFQVIQFPVGIRPRTNGLPVLHANGNLSAQFPVEIFVRGLFAASSLCSDQFRHNRNAIGILYRLAPCNLRQRGHHIGKIPQVIAHSPRLDLARPANGHRDAQAAFVKIPLAPTKLHTSLGVFVGAMDTARMIRCAKVIIATIVSAEKHNGILVELQLFQKI